MSEEKNPQGGNPEQKTQTIQKFQENTMEQVMKKVTEFKEVGSIHLPDDYSLPNAMRGAWLILQEMKDKNNVSVLQSCSKESIANALLDMATQGLSVSKKQGAFIQYGSKIVFQREYFGNIALAKRYSGMKEVRGNVIFKDDVFKYDVDGSTGRKRLIEHKQEVSNIDMTKIVGAYAIVQMNDGSTFMEVMSMPQIKQSWMQGPTKGDSPAHRNFPDQLAIKTVINRAVKILISASDDSVLMENVETNRRTDQIKAEIQEGANSGGIVYIPEEATIVEEEPTGEDTPPPPEPVKEELFPEEKPDGKAKTERKPKF